MAEDKRGRYFVEYDSYQRAGYHHGTEVKRRTTMRNGPFETWQAAKEWRRTAGSAGSRIVREP